VRVHKSSTASDSDGGWTDIVLDPARRVDLLSLTNGVLDELGQTPLDTGHYTQMRLVLAGNGATNPLANSVVPAGGGEVALTTPSAQQSGTKIDIDIDVAADQLADFVLDFDACKSVVRAGNSGRHLLKPVVRVVPRLISGVRGDLGAALAGASVSLQREGEVVRSTVADASGAFLLQPVPPGSYDLVVAADGRATVVVTGVAVAGDTVTTLPAFTAPASASASAAGRVTTGTTPVEADIRAVQALAGGATIQVAGGPADPATGDYLFVLPVAAPMVAPYATPPTPLAFAADTAAAGRYSIEASSLGATKSAGPLTFAAGATVTTDFVFP
jgi:hypothetical protein